MLDTQQLYYLPIWGVYLLMVVLLYLSINVDCRFGAFNQNCSHDNAVSGVGSMVGSSVVFLGFMLVLITRYAMNIYNPSFRYPQQFRLAP